jgi:hypothetical protein
MGSNVPTAERPPEGLDAYWLGVWRHALKQLQAQESWAWEQKPLLDEYVFALKGAEDARKGFKWLDALEVYAENTEDLPEIAWTTLSRIAGGLPAQWDKHTKRAMALADQLALTDRGRKAAGVIDGDEDEEPVSALDALDNVTPIRGRAG